MSEAFCDFNDFNLDFFNFPLPSQPEATQTQNATHHTKAEEARPAKRLQSVRNFASRIAKTNGLVEQVHRLQDENERCRQQFADFERSAAAVQKLFEDERRKRIEFELLATQRLEAYERLDTELASKNLHYDQLQAQWDEQTGPVQYSDLALKFLKLSRKVDDSLITHAERTFIEDITRYCKENNIRLPREQQSPKRPSRKGATAKVDAPAKAEASVQCNLWHQPPQAVVVPPKETRSQGTQCVQPPQAVVVPPKETRSQGTQCVAAKTRSQGTQHISTTTTRSTSTACFIQKHDVGTSFPLPKAPPPFSDVLIELNRWRVAKPISPIIDPLPKEPPQPAASTTQLRSRGTCTLICNVRRPIDYQLLPSEAIKPSNSRPPSRLLLENIKRELPGTPTPLKLPFDSFHYPHVSSLSDEAFEEMWCIFGQMMRGLLKPPRPKRTEAMPNNPNRRPEPDYQDWLRTMTDTIQLNPLSPVYSEAEKTPLPPKRSEAAKEIIRPMAQRLSVIPGEASKEDDSREGSGIRQNDMSEQCELDYPLIYLREQLEQIRSENLCGNSTEIMECLDNADEELSEATQTRKKRKKPKNQKQSKKTKKQKNESKAGEEGMAEQVKSMAEEVKCTAEEMESTADAVECTAESEETTLQCEIHESRVNFALDAKIRNQHPEDTTREESVAHSEAEETINEQSENNLHQNEPNMERVQQTEVSVDHDQTPNEPLADQDQQQAEECRKQSEEDEGAVLPKESPSMSNAKESILHRQNIEDEKSESEEHIFRKPHTINIEKVNPPEAKTPEIAEIVLPEKPAGDMPMLSLETAAEDEASSFPQVPIEVPAVNTETVPADVTNTPQVKTPCMSAASDREHTASSTRNLQSLFGSDSESEDEEENGKEKKCDNEVKSNAANDENKSNAADDEAKSNAADELMDILETLSDSTPESSQPGERDENSVDEAEEDNCLEMSQETVYLERLGESKDASKAATDWRSSSDSLDSSSEESSGSESSATFSFEMEDETEKGHFKNDVNHSHEKTYPLSNDLEQLKDQSSQERIAGDSLSNSLISLSSCHGFDELSECEYKSNREVFEMNDLDLDRSLSDSNVSLPSKMVNESAESDTQDVVDAVVEASSSCPNEEDNSSDDEQPLTIDDCLIGEEADAKESATDDLSSSLELETWPVTIQESSTKVVQCEDKDSTANRRMTRKRRLTSSDGEAPTPQKRSARLLAKKFKQIDSDARSSESATPEEATISHQATLQFYTEACSVTEKSENIPATCMEFESPASPPPANVEEEDHLEPRTIPLDLQRMPEQSSILKRIIGSYAAPSSLKKTPIVARKRKASMSKEIKTYLLAKANAETYDVCNVMEKLRCLTENVAESDVVLAEAIVEEMVKAPVDLTAGLKTLELPQPRSESLQRIGCLIEQLQRTRSTFTEHFLSRLENALFKCKDTEKQGLKGFVNLINLYLLAIRQTDVMMRSGFAANPARLLIAKCFYYHKAKTPLMVYEILCAFPSVLPHREERSYDHSDPLITVLQHLLMSTAYDMDNDDLRHKDLLSKLRFQYHYTPFTPSRQEVITNFMEKMRAAKLQDLPYAFAVLCKRMHPTKVTEDVIKPHLMPLANEFYLRLSETEEYDARAACLLETLSMILRPFPIDTPIKGYLATFGRFLNAVPRATVQEAAVQAVLRMQRFGFEGCYKTLQHFKPSYEMTPQTRAMLKTFCNRKPLQFWKEAARK